MVDDGSIASYVLCSGCLRDFITLCWGEDQQISLEVSGPVMRFGEMIEVHVGGAFHLLPDFHNSQVEEPFSPPTTRYTPFRFQPMPVMYVRALVIGRLHRIYQISGPDHGLFLRGVYEMLHELHRSPNFYPIFFLRQAILGVRFAPAQLALRHAKAVLKSLLGHSSRR